MNILTISNPKQIEELLIEKMKQSGVQNIGCNPSLPEVICQTWKWPSLKVFFVANHEPMAFLSVVLVGKTWVSLPHFDHGSLWVNPEFIEMVAPSENFSTQNFHNYFYLKLLEIVCTNKLTINANAIKIEINPQTIDFSKTGKEQKCKMNFACRSHLKLLNHHYENKIVPTINLMESWQQQFRRFNGNVRRKINKSLRNQITIQTGSFELVDAFYEVYRSNIHRLGSFGLPKTFFQNLLKNYQHGASEIFLARRQGKIAGAAILLTFLNVAENGWFSSVESYNRLYVTYRLHAAMMESAIGRGCNSYSFGRSTLNSSGHYYKQQWDATDVPLYFNTTKPGIFSLSQIEFVKKYFKHLPMAILKPFDKPVSHIIY
jgi:hypothetical protein